MSKTFVIIKDRFGDMHADDIVGEANTAAIKHTALRFSERIALDADETVLIGIVRARNAGEARLKPVADDDMSNGGIVWLYWLHPDSEFQEVEGSPATSWPKHSDWSAQLKNRRIEKGGE